MPSLGVHPRGPAKSSPRALTWADAAGRRCGRVTDVLVSLAEGPPGRADLARHRAITLQAGSHTGGPGTRSGPLLAIAAGQAARNGLCRPPAVVPARARAEHEPEEGERHDRKPAAPLAVPAVHDLGFVRMNGHPQVA